MDVVTAGVLNARRTSHAAWLVAAVTLVVLALAPASAHAALGLDNLSLTATSSVAGAHSNVRLQTDITGGGQPQGMRIDFPAGMLADVSAATVCSTTQFAANTCPSTSQIGTISADITVLDLLSGSANGNIYRLAAVTSGEVARMGIWLHPDTLLGVQAQDLTIVANATLRDASAGATDQAGLRATIATLPTSARVVSSSFPGNLIYPTGSTVNFDMTHVDMTLFGSVNGKPFMNNPGTCTAAVKPGIALLNSVGSVVAQLLPGSGSSSGFTPTGCDALTFAPTTAMTSVSPNMDTGTGMTVDVNVNDPLPTSGNVKAFAKKVVVTLPNGVEFNPPGAAPLTTCSNAQFADLERGRDLPEHLDHRQRRDHLAAADVPGQQRHALGQRLLR